MVSPARYISTDFNKATGQLLLTVIVDFLNSILWGYVLIYGLLAVGLFFTWRTGALQFRHFAEFFRVIRSSRETDASGITPFQAPTISLQIAPVSGMIAQARCGWAPLWNENHSR